MMRTIQVRDTELDEEELEAMKRRLAQTSGGSHEVAQWALARNHDEAKVRPQPVFWEFAMK